MIKLTSQNGDVKYDVREYVCDTPEDLKDLPQNAGMGSTCIVISTSDVYMINSEREWVKL